MSGVRSVEPSDPWLSGFLDAVAAGTFSLDSLRLADGNPLDGLRDHFVLARNMALISRISRTAKHMPFLNSAAHGRQPRAVVTVDITVASAGGQTSEFDQRERGMEFFHSFTDLIKSPMQLRNALPGPSDGLSVRIKLRGRCSRCPANAFPEAASHDKGGNPARSSRWPGLSGSQISSASPCLTPISRNSTLAGFSV